MEKTRYLYKLITDREGTLSYYLDDPSNLSPFAEMNLDSTQYVVDCGVIDVGYDRDTNELECTVQPDPCAEVELSNEQSEIFKRLFRDWFLFTVGKTNQ